MTIRYDYRNPALREHYVYRAFDAEGRLLYVGCSMRLTDRWKAHRADSKWARLAVRFQISGPYNYDTARQLERDALWEESPLYAWTPQRRGASKRHSRVFEENYFPLVAAGLSSIEAANNARQIADKAVPEFREGVPA